MISSLIVGSHFRPPAKQLLTILPIGTRLILEPEPDNPYDPIAIKVLVSLRESYPIAKWVQLEQALEGTGWTPHQLMEEEAERGPTQLGYLPRSGGKAAKGEAGNREVAEFIGPRPYTAILSTAADGSPAVIITISDEDEESSDEAQVNEPEKESA